jgi:hypothetical protein
LEVQTSEKRLCFVVVALKMLDPGIANQLASIVPRAISITASKEAARISHLFWAN